MRQLLEANRSRLRIIGLLVLCLLAFLLGNNAEGIVSGIVLAFSLGVTGALLVLGDS